MSNKEPSSKSNTAVRVAIVTGIFGLCTAVVTAVVGPIVAPVVQEMLLGTPAPVFAAFTADAPAVSAIRQTNTPTHPTDTAAPEPPTREPAAITGSQTPATDTFSESYDDFSDGTNDGKFNNKLWNAFSEEPACETVQQDGILIISNTLTNQDAACDLRIKRPPAVQGNELESLEAKMQILADSHGNHIFTALRAATFLDDIAWEVNCGIDTYELGHAISLWVVEAPIGTDSWRVTYDQHEYIDYETWYTVRLQIDPDTMTFSCQADGSEIGSYQPPNAKALRAAHFYREIANWRTNNSKATIYIDDFRLISSAP